MLCSAVQFRAVLCYLVTWLKFGWSITGGERSKAHNLSTNLVAITVIAVCVCALSADDQGYLAKNVFGVNAHSASGCADSQTKPQLIFLGMCTCIIVSYWSCTWVQYCSNASTAQIWLEITTSQLALLEAYFFRPAEAVTGLKRAKDLINLAGQGWTQLIFRQRLKAGIDHSVRDEENWMIETSWNIMKHHQTIQNWKCKVLTWDMIPVMGLEN